MEGLYYIDVSQYQGEIDWQAVKAAGVRGAFVRGAWCNYDGTVTQGLDSFFARNMAGANAAGLPVGAYVYSYALTPDAARAAARWLVQAVKPYQVELPLVLDIEDGPTYAPMGRKINSALAAAFCREVEQAGYYAMFYTYRAFAGAYLDMEALAPFDFWLAAYTRTPGWDGPFGIWQYSSTGRVPGISGRVDENTAYKDYPALIRAAGLNGLTAEKEEGVPLPEGACEAGEETPLPEKDASPEEAAPPARDTGKETPVPEKDASHEEAAPPAPACEAGKETPVHDKETGPGEASAPEKDFPATTARPCGLLALILHLLAHFVKAVFSAGKDDHEP